MTGNVIFYATTQRLQQCVDAVDLCFKFQAESDAAARFLAFQVDAIAVMASTP